jgi:hypothetical protein
MLIKTGTKILRHGNDLMVTMSKHSISHRVSLLATKEYWRDGGTGGQGEGIGNIGVYMERSF